MTLLAPWALWFSAIGAGVIALYLLKIKRRRQTVPALEFWLQLVSQTQVRSLFQRLKRWISLALWLLIVTCLVLALGNPVLSFGRVQPQAIAVILDNSASMQAVETESDNRPRLALALDAIQELTSRRPVTDEWLLIEAGREPRVLVPWTRDASAVRKAAETVQPHLGKADLQAAHRLTTQLLEAKERPCIVVMSDGGAGQVASLRQGAGANARAADGTTPVAEPPTSAEAVPTPPMQPRSQSEPDRAGQPAAGAPQIQHVHWPIGRADDNIGIAVLRVRTNRQQATHHAYIRLVNASAQEIQTQVVFELDSTTHSVEPAVVPPGGAWEKTVEFNSPAGGVLRASIDRPDASPADNEAFAILEPIRPVKVLLASSGNEAFFFERALAAMEPLVDVEASRTVTPAELERLDWSAERSDLAIFNNCVPASPPPSGAFIFVNAWPEWIGARETGVLDGVEMLVSKRDHALTRYLNLAAVRLARAREVDFGQSAMTSGASASHMGGTILARTPTGSPLIFLAQQPQRQALCLAFDVLDSDLPFRNAFPILLRNAVMWLVSEQAGWVRDQHDIGESVEPLRSVPASVKQVTVARLRGSGIEQSTLPVVNGSFVFDQTAEPGPLRFEIGDAAAFTAVNLTDELESRIKPDPAGDPAQELGLTRRLFGAAPWLGLTCAALMLVGFEWLTYHFRWTE